jgi:alpha-tubulin suppressor-like RCC1 family protein
MPAGASALRPVEVPLGQPIKKLALSGGSSCAITSDNRVVCWGDDQYGELGDGIAGGARSTPAFVKLADSSELNSVVDLGAGACSLCALTSISGVAVYCWGCNNLSQIGRPTTETAQSAVPLLVPSSSAARQLTVGDEAAGFFGGDMICGWGSNLGSALSGAAMTTFATPSCFSLASVLQPLLGRGYGCARLASGTVQCWGVQIGSDTIISPPGMAVPGVVATSLGGGMGHACVRDVNGNVRCWGFNSFGALGDGSSTDSTIPTTVVDAQGTALEGVLSGGITISAEAQHSCAILNDGSLYCWGWNYKGQVGNGVSDTIERIATPVRW